MESLSVPSSKSNRTGSYNMPEGNGMMWNNDLIPENINYTKPIIKESAI